ncbi:glycoside hydrolase family 35 protein [Hypoxylon trugodes]|uniref:glycoside hydrolase family 35 protein n=1 Tax=Hypoxylon trugodes TaxID=326681 RepID=UPI002192A0A0|nr:glycoside hydrolase family 35 protein [Hypoxylon trugodes]KAI1393322.1 glycoside hydrolase family 35 protein [Hypoxylon trugodes]
MRSSLFLVASQALLSCAFGTAGRPDSIIWDYAEKRALAQDIVTWDEHSLFVHGERVMIFSGEIHPFRLPVPSLWIDVLQKVRALGFNAVSIYIDWALLEGKPGDFSAEGVFDLKPFFEAATKAGIYIIARPGPYINAEVSGGGFPGWLQRVRGGLRTGAPDYLNATNNYMSNIGKIIADAQITNGGPVILLQPENEYTGANSFLPFPDGAYMEYVIQQARDAGIVVPFISNDASASGHNAPGTGVGEVDIYGHDGYPLGFDCAHPTVWPAKNFPTTYRANHLKQSPTTPFSIVEFQGGSFDPWGGWGFEQCSALVNHEFERVFYKNNYAAGVTIFNLYMIYGGTNWGNLGHPGGYTSYDYGSVIKEDRTVTREKYSELKLQATFIQSSPGYLTAAPGNSSTTLYSDNSDITVTPILANSTDDASFFVVRHTNYSSFESTQYKLKLPTSQGTLTVPRTNGSLSLNGRDSKVVVADYDVQGTRLLYSTADVFTHVKQDNRTLLFIYAGAGESNEFAIQGPPSGKVNQIQGGASYKVASSNSSNFFTVSWTASTERSILQIGDDVYVYLLDRNSAYNYWLTDIQNSTSKLIINGPYLVRTASVSNDELHIKADFNATTTVDIIGVPQGVSKLFINDVETATETSGLSVLAGVTVKAPSFSVPDLTGLDWKYLDSLPELQTDYDDSLWTNADHTYTDNTKQPILATVSTYGSDYGYHTGVLVYRGHFNATGNEVNFSLWTQGGTGFASSIWLDDHLVSSFLGNPANDSYQGKYDITGGAGLEAGSSHVFTVVVENVGLTENYDPGEDDMKAPRGILGWRLETSKATNTPITWKLAGNFGGEDYLDRVRGPLNEGGLYIERQGYHLPSAPTAEWTSHSPLEGIGIPGIAYYSTTFDLNLPSDQWDIPLAFSFENNTETSGAYRAQLYVNGWQFGKLSSNIGPQTVFPVPEGILNYNGTNSVGITLWALEEGGAKVPGLSLVASTPVWTGREKVELVESPTWNLRENSF